MHACMHPSFGILETYIYGHELNIGYKYKLGVSD